MSTPDVAKLDRQKLIILIAVLTALFLGALDQTIVATALPDIVKDLNGLDRYTWVTTVYLMFSTALVPIYGKLADMMSRKKIELFAIGVFMLGSLLSGLSGEFGAMPIIGDGMNQLILFRSIQGIGGAGLFSMAFIVIADLFPPAERGKYQGYVGVAFGMASVLGPLTGGLLTDHAGGWIPGVEGWRWIFYVNVPFAILAIAMIVRNLPPLIPRGAGGKLDLLSAAYMLIGVMAFIVGLQINKVEYGWASPLTLGLLVGGLLFLTLFVLRSIRIPSPVLALSLFQNRVFITAIATLILLGCVFLGVTIFLPLFMVNVLGVSATKAGISLLPLTMSVVFGATVAGQLSSRYRSYKKIMLVGASILVLGIFLLSTMSTQIPYWQVALYMGVVGLGVGPSLPLYTLAIQNAVEPTKIGQATSASQFFRQMGRAIGSALLGALLVFSLSSYLGDSGITFSDLTGPNTPTGPEQKAAFAHAIDNIFRTLLVLSCLGWFSTWLVPDLRLRMEHDGSTDFEG